MYNGPRRKVTHIVVLGDSLSDRGMLWDRKFLGWIYLMRKWSGLVGYSPDKRFTNGYVWVDYLAEFYAKEFKKEEDDKKNSPDLFLEDSQRITWEKHDFIRSFAEGGVAAYQFIFTPLTTFVGFITRLILRTLAGMRDLLVADDVAMQNRKREKAETLIVDWTGANDLITVNLRPTVEEARLAVSARIKNVKKLIKQGYQNFMLFDLPDLTLAPRFRNLQGPDADKTRQDAKDAITEFNKLIREEVDKLKELYPQIKVDVKGVSTKFKKIIEDCEKNSVNGIYGFDRDKIATPFKGTSGSEAKPGEKETEAPGYMFYDDVHPTTAMHKVLADKAKKGIAKHYRVVDPNFKIDVERLDVNPGDLVAAFKKKYDSRFSKDVSHCFGLFAVSNMYRKYWDKFDEIKLEDIFDHAMNGGTRTFRVLCSLGWINHKGELLATNVPALRAAYDCASVFSSKHPSQN